MTSTKFIKEIELLLQTIQDINSSNVKGENILHECVKRYGRVDVVEFLQSKGADLHSKTTKYGKNVIHLAIESIKKKNWNSIQKLIKYLIEQKVDVNACDWSGDTALHYVVRNCTNVAHSIPLIDLLIKSGVLIDVSNNMGQTALHFAVELDNYALSEYLISVGASVDCKTKQLKSALQISVEKCNYKISKLLIQNSATVNCMMDEEGSLLHIAINSSSAGKKRMDLVKLLIHSGVDVNACDASLSLPLHLALQNKDEDCARFLVDEGSLIDHYNGRDDTPLRIAVMNELEKSVELLLHRGADPNDIKRKRGYDFWSDRSLMHHAFLSSKLSIIEHLIKYGAIVSPEDKSVGLSLSVGRDNFSMLKYLMRNGADLSVRSLYSGNPLSYALFGSRNRPENMVQFLIDHGVNVIEVEPLGFTRYISFWDRRALCFVRHLALLTVEGLDIGPQNLTELEKDASYKEYYMGCQRELLSMKNATIPNTTLTLYDLLSRKYDETLVYFQNESVVAVVKSDKISSSYPRYSWNLRYRLIRGQERCDLINKGRKFFNTVVSFEIPVEILNLICKHLSNDDLSNLSKVRFNSQATPEPFKMSLRTCRKRKNFFQEESWW